MTVAALPTLPESRVTSVRTLDMYRYKLHYDIKDDFLAAHISLKTGLHILRKAHLTMGYC